MEESVREAAEKFCVRPFGPLNGEHPLVRDRTECFLCKGAFEVGEHPTLVVLDSEENREAKTKAGGGFYSAVATPVHWTCITGSDTPREDFEEYFSRE